MLFRRSRIGFKVSKGDIVMRYHQKPNSNSAFWLIVLATAFIAVAFIVEIFIKFYLEVI
jgi:hypothetical protein